MNIEPFQKERAQVQLRRLRELGDQQAASLSPGEIWRARLKEHWLFIAVVIVPVLLSCLYFFVIASDSYVSEAKYVVRTPSEGGGSLANSLSGIVQSSGISKSTDDAHVINAYLLSRDALDFLRQTTDLDKIYAAPNGDFLSRYPRLFSRRTNEAQFKYYLSIANVRYDKTTGISTLSVSAFEPRDAQLIALKLMEAGEQLANRLSVRMREDLVQRATQEAEVARARSREAQNRITEWRNREAQIDPTRFSAAIVEVIARLSFELAQLRAQKAELERASPQNPLLAPLQNKIAALVDQIEIERRALTGSSASLAPKIVDYELLQLEKIVAERLLAAALSALETARSDAQKQQIYLERIVSPQLADYPSYPQRMTNLAMIAGGALLIFMVLSKILENISRHGEFARYFHRRKAA